VTLTAKHYDLAIEALTRAKTQFKPDGKDCAICGGNDHQAFECGRNPMVAMTVCHNVAEAAEKLHNLVHAHTSGEMEREVYGKVHEFLHYLAGHNSRIGLTVGPRAVVSPSDDQNDWLASNPMMWLYLPIMRRSTEDIAREADDIVRVLRANGSAMRAEQLAQALQVPTRQLEKPLKLLRRNDRLLVAGAKRWTEYALKSSRPQQAN
jgi:hypothetical protein